MALSERDQQAVYNFYLEGRYPFGLDMEIEENLIQRFATKETLAEHFGCSIADVSLALQRPWIQSRKGTRDLGRGSTWWESDHSDPLELVKLYYPSHVEAFFSRAAVLDRQTQEAKRPTVAIDPEAYLEKRFGPGYASADNIKLVERKIDEIIERLEAVECEYGTTLVLSILDDWIK